MKTETEKLRERIIRLRSEGRPWPEIAGLVGRSRTRCIQIAHESGSKPPNPAGKPKRYSCGACGGTFVSSTKWPPDRAKCCGSYDWRRRS